MTRIAAAVRRELVRIMRERYRTAIREERERILDELVRLSGYHRKYAIGVLNGPDHARTSGDSGVRRGRPRLYDAAVREAITMLWETSDRVCGKRLKALLPILVPALERHGHLQVDIDVREKVLGASGASLDRVLKKARSATPRRRRRLATRLRKSIPVRTFAEWNDPLPGSMEGDLVAHCGDTVAGSFVHTLTLTDIASGWTECIPLVLREGILVRQAIDGVRRLLPRPGVGRTKKWFRCTAPGWISTA